MRDNLPWLFVIVLLFTLFFMRGCDGSAVVEARNRAVAAEDSLAVLVPRVDSLLAVAARSDTVLVQVTDTIRVTVERLRVDQVIVIDSIAAIAAPEVVALVADLTESHAQEVAALEELAAANLLWGQGWKSAAETLEPAFAQAMLRGDAWEDAFDASRRQARWFQVGGVGLAALAVFAFLR